MGSYLKKIDKTLRYHLLQVLTAARGGWWDLIHPRVDRPIFIIGCSRAGTTLVYKTFSESAEIGSLQREIYAFWSELHPLSERQWNSHGIAPESASESDRAALSRYFYARTGHTRFVDKNNQNGLCVAYLDRLFPDARFVYVKRSPGDNINSLIEGWRRPDEFATWSNALPAEVRIDAGTFNRWCFFLAEGWRGYLQASIEEVCAFQYRAMNQAILESRERVPQNRWIEIRYEQLLQDPIGGFKEAFEACNLSFTSHLETHCSTVLKRPYNAFSEIRQDKWKSGANQERIGHVLPMVKEVAKAMGYDV